MKTHTIAATNAKPFKSPACNFFYTHADYSYQPTTETPDQGKRRCAKALARAERYASAMGYSFEWSLDGVTNREWTKKGPEYGTWECVARDAQGDVVGSLCGVDFGVGGEPWGDPYRRVVEAEIASEAIA